MFYFCAPCTCFFMISFWLIDWNWKWNEITKIKCWYHWYQCTWNELELKNEKNRKHFFSIWTDWLIDWLSIIISAFLLRDNCFFRCLIFFGFSRFSRIYITLSYSRILYPDFAIFQIFSSEIKKIITPFFNVTTIVMIIISVWIVKQRLVY